MYTKAAKPTADTVPIIIVSTIFDGSSKKLCRDSSSAVKLNSLDCKALLESSACNDIAGMPVVDCFLLTIAAL